MINAPAATAAQRVAEEMNRRLSMQELADRYGIALQTVRQWRVKGEGPRGMKIGRFVRYRIEDVLEWEEKQLDPH